MEDSYKMFYRNPDYVLIFKKKDGKIKHQLNMNGFRFSIMQKKHHFLICFNME